MMWQNFAQLQLICKFCGFWYSVNFCNYKIQFIQSIQSIQ